MNLSYLDWYLVEIRRHLHGSIPHEQLNSFEFETRNHLESQTEDFIAQGMDRRAAEIAAIERFGRPEDIAKDCLKGHRNQTILTRTIFAGIGFVLLVILNQFSQFADPSRPPFSQGYVNNMAWLVLGFGLFALAIGKMPKLRWFAFPGVVIAVLCIVYGKQNTFFGPTSTPAYPGMSQVVLHEQFLQLRVDNANLKKIEHSAAVDWRNQVGTAKDMKKGESLKIARIVYNTRSNNTVYYTTTWFTSGGTAGEGGWSGALVNRNIDGTYVFQSRPALSQITLEGPLTKRDVQKAISGRINEVELRSKTRDRLMARMQSGLNVRVYVRILSIIRLPLLTYIFIVFPLSYCVCMVTSKWRYRSRAKANRMRLA
jgi:hypothetical protein